MQEHLSRPESVISTTCCIPACAGMTEDVADAQLISSMPPDTLHSRYLVYWLKDKFKLVERRITLLSTINLLVTKIILVRKTRPARL